MATFKGPTSTSCPMGNSSKPLAPLDEPWDEDWPCSPLAAEPEPDAPVDPQAAKAKTRRPEQRAAAAWFKVVGAFPAWMDRIMMVPVCLSVCFCL